MQQTVVTEEELLGMFERLQAEHTRVLQMLLLTQVRLDRAVGELTQANARITAMEAESQRAGDGAADG